MDMNSGHDQLSLRAQVLAPISGLKANDPDYGGFYLEWDPMSHWQRGTNENTNGLLRQYFPKGTDMAALTQADLDKAAHSLYGRPRQTLDGMTPSEKLAEVLQ